MYRFIFITAVDVLALVNLITSKDIPMRVPRHHGDSIALVKRHVALNESKSPDVPKSGGSLTDVPTSGGSLTLTDVPKSGGSLTDVPKSGGSLTDVPKSDGSLTDVPKSGGSLCLIADTTHLTVVLLIIAILVAQLAIVVLLICLIRVIHRKFPTRRPMKEIVSHIYERIDENVPRTIVRHESAPRTIVRHVTLPRGTGSGNGYMDMTFAKVAQNDHGQGPVEVYDYNHDNHNDGRKASEAGIEAREAINLTAGPQCSVTGVWTIGTGEHEVGCDSRTRCDSECEQNNDDCVRIYL